VEEGMPKILDFVVRKLEAPDPQLALRAAPSSTVKNAIRAGCENT
jgi:hypothetical protein